MNLNKFFKTTFFLIFFAEYISFISYLTSPFWFKFSFMVILLSALILAFWGGLEYFLYVLLAEIFVSSKGYLFFWDFGGIKISIRIALWLLFMSVFLAKFVIIFFKKKKKAFESFLQNPFFSYFMVLFAFIVWGVVNALLNKNSFATMFFDVNAWFFFLLLFPFLFIERTEKFLKNILSILLASSFWISLETLFLFYVFTHKIFPLNSFLYKWVRDTGVGEITAMGNGFSRIFFQSHIYVIVSFFLLFFLFVYYFSKFDFRQIFKIRNFYFYLFLFLLFIAVNLIGLSRSNWLGIILALLLSFVLVYYFYGFKVFLRTCFGFLGASFLAVLLIVVIFKFPYPQKNNANPINLISERASQVKNEAGVSSRWSLLPKLLGEIKENPVLGKGFGTLITYKSSDPRVLASNPTGLYTTYAFEWGWLDVWLKIGVFGLLAYLALLLKILMSFKQIKEKIYKKNKDDLIKLSLLVSFFAIIAINFFSPYLNHPLGITYLLLLILFFSPLSGKAKNTSN